MKVLIISNLSPVDSFLSILCEITFNPKTIYSCELGIGKRGLLEKGVL